LLTESRKNLQDLFVPGQEVVAYEEPDDLLEKIRRYVEDEASRCRIAAAGQARTSSEHTYKQRMEELVALLRAHARG
jgi:spore maturation protein CgeB